MTLIALPAFRDNYIWLLHDGIQALVVDPGDAQPVFDALCQWGLALRAILVTHHHPDHTGGVAALREATGATVWGPATESIPQPFERLREGDTVSFGPIAFDVLDVPGHTAGHIAYFAASAPLAGGDTDATDAPLLFCGDTLFSGGCGRLFEGTPAQMLASLDKLAALPGHTRVCCTHEYTLANLRFACAVEPANDHLLQYQAACAGQRAAGHATLPSRIDTERAINPFLRSRLPAVADAVRAHAGQSLPDEAEVFGALREWKNHFQ